MNETDERDDLWHLLGKAKQPRVSPFFSRNVLREVRTLRQEKPGVFESLRRNWQLVSACAAAVVIAALVALQQRAPEADPLAAITEQVAEEVSASSDYLVITELDELLAFEDNDVWLDTPVY